MNTKDTKGTVLVNSQGDDGNEKLSRPYSSPAIVYPHHVRNLVSRSLYATTMKACDHYFNDLLSTMTPSSHSKLKHSKFLAALVFEDFDACLHEEWTKHTATMTTMPILE